jgi:chromosome segregation ATPase
MDRDVSFQGPNPLEHERAKLAERLRALNDEIREYPQPIARCDAQLAGLLEDRLRIRARLEALATF